MLLVSNEGCTFLADMVCIKIWVFFHVPKKTLFTRTGSVPDLFTTGVEHRYDQTCQLQGILRLINKNIKYKDHQ